MSGRASVSWQTSLADLSLILFMVTAAAVSTPRKAVPGASGKAWQSTAAARQERAEAPAIAEPLSVYIAAADAPPLRDWLAQQAPDPRQQLTITAHYDAGRHQGLGAAVEEALRLAREASAAGMRARVVVEPGSGAVRAALAFDAANPDAGLAR
ncbi:hypothetical protein HT136_18720 [Novosphingobium profundi]|uniref:hypothetical protein n=1 Tax=Novosphingobium profundi TaxID=1774954 RepID=UPI001BD96410|nr:hypothetical protein [Novosphingobium profundi]MBT0670405.1 hypothetical protein [Novosphingobium profundi]